MWRRDAASVVRYMVRGLDAPNADGGPVPIIGKQFSHARSARLSYYHLRLLSDGPFGDGPPSACRARVGLAGEHRLLFYREDLGHPLDSLLDGPAGADGVRDAALWLAQLHTSDLTAAARALPGARGREHPPVGHRPSRRRIHPSAAAKANVLASRWAAAARSRPPSTPSCRCTRTSTPATCYVGAAHRRHRPRRGPDGRPGVRRRPLLHLPRSARRATPRWCEEFLDAYATATGWADKGTFAPFRAYACLKIAKQAVGRQRSVPPHPPRSERHRRSPTSALARGAALGRHPVARTGHDRIALTTRGRVVYVVRSWPRLSQTFIVNEVLALERRGVQLDVVSLVRSGETVVQPQVADVRAPGHLPRRARTPRSAPTWPLLRRRSRAATCRRWPLCLRRPGLAAGYGDCSALECLDHAARVAAAHQRLRDPGRPTHVHAHFAHDPALVGMLAATLAGLPFSFTGHARDLYQIPAEQPRRPRGPRDHAGHLLRGQRHLHPRHPARRHRSRSRSSTTASTSTGSRPPASRSRRRPRARLGRSSGGEEGIRRPASAPWPARPTLPPAGSTATARSATSSSSCATSSASPDASSSWAAATATRSSRPSPPPTRSSSRRRMTEDGDRDGIPERPRRVHGLRASGRHHHRGRHHRARRPRRQRAALRARGRRRNRPSVAHGRRATRRCAGASARPAAARRRPTMTSTGRGPARDDLFSAARDRASRWRWRAMSTMLAESSTAHCGRFLEALQAAPHGPELAAVLTALAHRRLVTSSTPSTSPASAPSSSTSSATGWCAATCSHGRRRRARRRRAGLRVSAFPHDAGPAEPPAADGPRRRRPAAGRLRPLARRPAALPARQARHGAGPVRRRPVVLVAKAYHKPDEGGAVAEESVALADAVDGATTFGFAPTVAHLDDLGWVVQRPVRGPPLDALVGNPRLCPARRRGRRAPGRPGAGRAARVRPDPAPRAVGRQGAAALRHPVRRDRHGGSPALGDLGAGLAAAAHRRLDDLPPARIGPVHGDCKPSQFLLARLHASTCSTSTTAASPTRPPTSARSWRRCGSSPSATRWPDDPRP